MKTMAVAAALAADAPALAASDAPALAASEVEAVMVVPSLEACSLMAS